MCVCVCVCAVGQSFWVVGCKKKREEGGGMKSGRTRLEWLDAGDVNYRLEDVEEEGNGVCDELLGARFR